MLNWVRRLVGAKPSGRERLQSAAQRALADAVHAMVDVSKESADTSKLFRDAVENWHADASIRRDVRKKARYEVLNNAYLRGLVRTKQVDLIGTGPRLHVVSDDREAGAEVEQKFARWLADINGQRLLRSMVFDWFVAGESFSFLTTNDASPNPVKLAVKVLDVEQIDDISDPDKKLLEGIQYDDFGNPVNYYVFPSHPADSGMTSLESQPVEARWVCHLFSQDRASQVRGLSELTSCLVPAALLRSFTLAVVKAANIAASLSFLVHTDEIGEDSTACEPYDVIDLEHGTGMALPDGYRATQLKAEQPVDNYGEFKGELLTEVGRPVLMPRLKIAGDASKYNYSSGRLDGQEYYHGNDVERNLIEQVVLDRWFAEWWYEAITVPDYLTPAALGLVMEDEYPAYPRHRWGWDGRPHVDPQKEANAIATELANGLTGLHELYAKRGLNCEDELENSARCLGIPVEQYKSMIAASIFKQQKTQQPAGRSRQKQGSDNGKEDSGQSAGESKDEGQERA